MREFVVIICDAKIRYICLLGIIFMVLIENRQIYTIDLENNLNYCNLYI